MSTHKCSILVITLLIIIAGNAFCQPEEDWSLMAKKAISGEKLTPEIVDRCHEQFVAYGVALVAKNNAKNLAGLSDEDNAMHYVNSIMLAMIDPKRHAEWPFRHVGIHKSYVVIKEKLKNQDDVHLLAAVIIPAIDNGKAKFALASYRSLKAQDPFLAKYILETVQKHYSESWPAKKFLAEESTELYSEIMIKQVEDGNDLIFDFIEAERHPKYSIICIKRSSATSSPPMKFLIKVCYEIAKIRGVNYFVNLDKWSDNDDNWFFKIGFSPDDNLAPYKYFKEYKDIRKDLKFFSVDQYLSRFEKE